MTSTPTRTPVLDKTVVFQSTAEMKEQLEIVRRHMGERSVGAVVRKLCEQGIAEHAPSAV